MESCKHGTPKMRFCFQCEREKDPEFDTGAVIKKLRARVHELERELKNIAEANYRDWEDGMNRPSDFVAWAKNRARHILNVK